jgi:branched-chain amino acid transport system substrate-binding protein
MNHRISRRAFTALLLAGASAAAMPTATFAAEESITIGMLSAFTGPFASFGQLQKEGAELALEQWNYEVAGKKIKMIYADDQLDNELAVTKAKQLVEQDKVDVVTGLVSGDEGLSVGGYMKGKNIPVVPMYSASEDMTMREWYPFIVRPTWTGAQPMDVFGYWLAKEKGLKKIYMIGEDYSYPYNQAGGFKRGFLRGGGEEVTTVWHAVPTSDYSSIIASIPLDKGYDAVLYNGAGSDAVAFVKQYVEFGMQAKIPLFGQSNTFEKPDLDSMPQEIVGAYSAHLTADDLNTPNWNKFRDAFVKRWGHSPSAASEFAYGSMELILRAIKARGGDVADKAALVDAMKTADISDEPRGPVSLDAFNAAIENVYIRQVALADDGTMYNKGLFTAKNVSQFGPYDPKLYMSQPADGRDSPAELRSALPAEMLQVSKDYEFVSFGQ